MYTILLIQAVCIGALLLLGILVPLISLPGVRVLLVNAEEINEVEPSIVNAKFDHLLHRLESIHNEYTNSDDKLETATSTESESTAAMHIASSYLIDTMQPRLNKLLSTNNNKVKTPQCKAKIIHHFNRYISAIANEDPLPFSQTVFPNECPDDNVIQDYDNLPDGVTIMSLMNKTYQPLRNESLYIDNEDDLILLYGILTHGRSGAVTTIRLIEALSSTYSGGDDNDDDDHKTIFVVHVDGKEESDDTFDELVQYSLNKGNVHILPTEFRIRVNWGGFTMVNATLQILKYAFALLPQSSTSTKLPETELNFHKFIHLASSTYPIRSNTQIRKTIGSFPLDANLFYIAPKPVKPHPSVWQYFVECDDAVHRIYRLHPLSLERNGIRQYMGSQWFISSYEFAKYVAIAQEGSLVQQYIEYAKHIVVADEGFFSTVLKHSRFCQKYHNSNFLHLAFDRWESDLENIDRDERKCLMPDPNQCGRSPTILTKDYLFAMEMTNDLFARKFADDGESELKDILDIKRREEEEKFRDIAAGTYTEKVSTIKTSFEGLGTLIVAKETIHDYDPLCLGLGNSGNKVKLVPCFHPQVLGTLSNDWASGAVIEEEVLINNRWEVGPCSSDGSLKWDRETAEMIMKRGLYSPSGPHCMIKQRGGTRNGRCIDIEGERVEPGGILQVFPCLKKWHQMFGFGDGIISRNATIFGTVPTHIINALKHKGREQKANLCFGVIGRGNIEYKPWKEDMNKEHYNTVDFLPRKAKKVKDGERLKALRLWKSKQLVTIPCNDVVATLEFLFVPFIVEEEVVEKKIEEDLSSDEILSYHGNDEL